PCLHSAPRLVRHRSRPPTATDHVNKETRRSQRARGGYSVPTAQPRGRPRAPGRLVTSAGRWLDAGSSRRAPRGVRTSAIRIASRYNYRLLAIRISLVLARPAGSRPATRTRVPGAPREVIDRQRPHAGADASAPDESALCASLVCSVPPVNVFSAPRSW